MKKQDKRRTASFMPKRALKVYKVTFAQSVKDDEYMTVDGKTVLAENAHSAITEAFALLSMKDQKTYYAQEVELIAIID